MYKFEGNGVVWDPEKNKKLCKFVNGFYSTKSVEEARKLVILGYRSNDKIPFPEVEKDIIIENCPSKEVEANKVNYEKLTLDDLREIAKGKKITIRNKNKAQIIKEIVGE